MDSSQFRQDSAGHTLFEKRIKYQLEDLPNKPGTLIGDILDMGVPPIFVYHRFMKEYGYIDFEQWNNMPVVIRSGLWQCLNIENEWHNKKQQEVNKGM